MEPLETFTVFRGFKFISVPDFFAVNSPTKAFNFMQGSQNLGKPWIYLCQFFDRLRLAL
jgi:hypothetical protein